MDYTLTYVVLVLPEGLEDKEENKIEVEKEIDINVSYSSGYDGIGPYEYWGCKGYDKGNLCIDIDKITYDKTGLTEQEIKAIEDAILDQDENIVQACNEDIADQKSWAAEAKYEASRDRFDD